MLARAFIGALTFAISANAGVVYHFSTKFVGGRFEVKQSGKVWVEGNSYRFEIDPDASKSQRPFDVAISTDADTTAKFLNTNKQTWWDRQRVGTMTRSSMLFDLPMAGGKVGRRRVQLNENGTETIAGHEAKKHVIDIDYQIEARIDGSPLRGNVKATAIIWTAESLPRLPLQRPLKTGFDEVDRDLAQASAKIKGMVLRHELTVTRTLAGGPPVTETVTTIVDDVDVMNVDPSRFEVPSGFRYEAP
ncbi:MAG TPA: hypothetical protein VMU84_12935 [Thermoanaerobaculia bacterium]|nr:hypothetical protein [Thermoanaerobaculia bacterium]